MIGLVSNFIDDESGVSSIEYSLLVAGIVFAAVFTVNAVGTSFAATLWESAVVLDPGSTGAAGVTSRGSMH